MNNPLLWEPQNDINKFVFKTLTENQPPADLEVLEEAVKDYIEIVSQSSNGATGDRKKSKNHNFETDADAVTLTILVETAALVLSGQLEKLKQLEESEKENK